MNDIQQQVLDSDARRLALISPTGTGKTIAFLCALLPELIPSCDKIQAVILSPSRELTIQTAEIVRKACEGYKTVALYGGHSMTDEVNSLRPLPDIVVATPGRLLDHLQRSNLEIKNPRCVVIDEYDKSLELGFEGEMKRIFSRIGRVGRLVLTSATKLNQLPEYLDFKNAELIENLNTENPSNRMDVIEVRSYVPDKLDTLCDLLRSFPSGQRSIVFVNHRDAAERVFDRLSKEKIDSGLYHGGLEQQQRANAIDLLTNGTTPVLVATDLAARGLDIADVNNIIHYHLPVDEAAWTHRNGRTARVDASGTIYVILSDNDTLPSYMTPDREFTPKASDSLPRRSGLETLRVDAGKKEKISRGDIVGFLCKNTPVDPSKIGKISLYDHYALVAVPFEQAREILQLLADKKLKGKKTRISRLKSGRS